MPLVNSSAAPRFFGYRNLFGLHNGWIRGINIPRHQSSLISFAPQSTCGGPQRWALSRHSASKVLADRSIVCPTSSEARCPPGLIRRPIGVTLDNAGPKCVTPSQKLHKQTIQFQPLRCGGVGAVVPLMSPEPFVDILVATGLVRAAVIVVGHNVAVRAV
jgi:hypothetical protein